MGFAILPMVVALFFAGVATQAGQLAASVDGSGDVGLMESHAVITAQQAEVFGSACVDAAIATPGLVSSSISASLPAGVSVPGGAVCMATAAAGGGRNVYAYLPAAPGAAGKIVSDTQTNVAWSRVSAQGQAVNLVTGTVGAVPASIPVGSLLDWVQVNP